MPIKKTSKNSILKPSFHPSWLSMWIRMYGRLRFRTIRSIAHLIALLWLRKVHNKEKLPQDGPAIVISNHTSYYDWAILSALYDHKYVVFLANQSLLRRPFVSWLMRMHILIYINPQNPGFAYFREVIRRLRQKDIVVIYPEGTRSRTGRMLRPKIGFVKLALKTNVPIIPIGMKGAYRILPPHRRVPRLRRCEVFVGDPIYINAENPMFADVFSGKKNKRQLSDLEYEKIAIRIMDLIAKMVGQEWEDLMLRRKVRK